MKTITATAESKWELAAYDKGKRKERRLCESKEEAEELKAYFSRTCSIKHECTFPFRDCNGSYLYVVSEL
jgi:hypothetical protein